ncbi:hypothetical protein ACH42_09065 [Endozoicomonas sp. (ex Bugula neritina AB1)]|nr:hypothetical protein ACH42_09065 [Endozoicomonas sp. (ex Bugula neritina AB1)]
MIPIITLYLGIIPTHPYSLRTSSRRSGNCQEVHGVDRKHPLNACNTSDPGPSIKRTCLSQFKAINPYSSPKPIRTSLQSTIEDLQQRISNGEDTPPIKNMKNIKEQNREYTRKIFLLLQNLPKEQLVRLMIDGDLLEKEGYQGYLDREPQSIKQYAKAWNYACESILGESVSEISIDFLKKLHAKTFPLVTVEEGRVKGIPAPAGSFFHDYKTDIASKINCKIQEAFMFFSLQGNYTLDGLSEAEQHRNNHYKMLGIPMPDEEKKMFYLEAVDAYQDNILLDAEELKTILLIKLKLDEVDKEGTTSRKQKQNVYNSLKEKDKKNILKNPDLYDYALGLSSNQYRLNTYGISSEHQNAILENIMSEFNLELKKVSDLNSLLTILSTYIPQLLQVHPFYDANGRVFYLLTQLLLISHGYPPMMMDNPNKLDMYDKESLKLEMKSAMQKTLSHSLSLINGTHEHKSWEAGEEAERLCKELQPLLECLNATKIEASFA